VDGFTVCASAHHRIFRVASAFRNRGSSAATYLCLAGRSIFLAALDSSRGLAALLRLAGITSGGLFNVSAALAGNVDKEAIARD
jgi:hypothetical protein